MPTSGLTHPPPPQRILVVDDHRDSAVLLTEYLRMSGYEAEATTNGAAALQWAETRMPACVLVDLRMPQMSGFELGRRLRERHGRAVTLVAMTGMAPDHTDYLAMQALCDHVLDKPVDLDELRRVLPPAPAPVQRL